MRVNAEIGIFGGSGFYSFFDNAEEMELKTPYGNPSDKLTIGKVEDKTVAFLPRHGKNHQFAPNNLPYKANIYAMKMLGVKSIIAPSACGSLQEYIKPGDFVICNQFIDRTKSREDTFFDGGQVQHISAANPYNEDLRMLAINSAEELSIPVHKTGTVVVIEGPRFSTKAESQWFSKMGWEVINMTQYPECYLALEMGIPYVNISLITDYDAGLDGNTNIKPVTHEEVLKVFNNNLENVKSLIRTMIKSI